MILIAYEWKTEKKVKRKILANEKVELDYLQQLTDARIELLAPLPIRKAYMFGGMALTATKSMSIIVPGYATNSAFAVCSASGASNGVL